MIHYVTPYRSDKDLGKAYNDAFNYCDDDDWLCLRDIDTMFLTPDAPNIISRYVQLNPFAGMLTCFTNRVGSTEQLLGGSINENTNIKDHIRWAEQAKNWNHTSTELHGDISGMLMVVSKKVWKQHKFIEGIGCLGVDTDFGRRIRESGLSIIRMDALYIFHIYRMQNGIYNKKHLK